MKTRDLIESLVRDARPVRRLPGPPVLALAFMAGALPLVALEAVTLEVRRDLALKLDEAWFFAAAGLLVAASFAAALAVATLALPGRKGLRAGLGLATVLLLAMVGLTLSRTPWIVVPTFGAWLGRGVQCAVGVLLVAVAPGLAGLWLLRRGAPVRPALAGALLGLAVGVLGTMALGWMCDWDEPAHVLVSHLLVPVAALAAAGAWAGGRWLRW
jgi:hypothetical protein